MRQAQINVRTRACSRTSIARTKQAALTHNVRGKELNRFSFMRYFRLSYTDVLISIAKHSIPSTSAKTVTNIHSFPGL